jgi:L-histidine N-alpha-methyltransferase
MLFGGTVGNLYPGERRAFFQDLARGMEASDALLLGVDLVKDAARLEAAYGDPEGVTAEFNRNALRVLNRRFGADFDPAAFAHRAFYDPENAWIEMRLRASRPMRVQLPALDLVLDLSLGAEVRTEVSCKFTLASIAESAAEGGLALSHWYGDPEGLFRAGGPPPERPVSEAEPGDPQYVPGGPEVPPRLRGDAPGRVHAASVPHAPPSRAAI